MLNIAVCDDVAIVADGITKMIKEIGLKWEKDWSIKTYYCGEELLKNVENIDAVFLDVLMPGMDGINVGRNIHNINPDCRIVMVTGDIGYVNEAFKIRAFRYLSKPIVQYQVEEALESIEAANVGNKLIEVYNNRNAYKIREKDIYFVKTMGGYCEIYAKNIIFRKEASLNEIENMLEKKIFFRVHREYLVNMGKIDERRKREVMIGERKIPVSFRREKSFEHAYMEFDLYYR